MKMPPFTIRFDVTAEDAARAYFQIQENRVITSFSVWLYTAIVVCGREDQISIV
jgi:hypothetical protein